MYRDVFNRVKIEQLTDPAVTTATVTSDACGLAGYEGAMFSVLFGESADTLCAACCWNCKLQESDASGSGYADVAAADVIGAASDAFGAVDDAADDDAIYSLGYKGTKAYVKVVVTKTGTHASGTPIAIVAVKFKSVNPPSNVVTP